MMAEADWEEEQTRAQRLRASVLGMLALGGLSIPAMVLGSVIASGATKYVISAAFILLVIAPVVIALVRITEHKQQLTNAKVRLLARELSEALRAAEREAEERDMQSRRQHFESRLANALDMAGGEPEVLDVIERSFTSVLPGSSVELLLADSSQAHLTRMANVAPAGEPARGVTGGCGVDSPDQCPAARRAQTQHFSDSTDLDACPKLRQRQDGPLSALCVPVSIMGRTVGVIHATGAPGAIVEGNQVHDLTTLAKLGGARLGLLRVMAETQLQASTDSLTGLLNRRSFEEKSTALRRRHPVLTVVMADLDHFKALNDTYGHNTGDRALRLFAQVLQESMRADDVICRHGGEEFAIALPACPPETARSILNSMRVRLDAAITVAGAPKYTVSFGVTEAHTHEELSTALERADRALFDAKLAGRDRVVVHDNAGQVVHGDDMTDDGEAEMRRVLPDTYRPHR